MNRDYINWLETLPCNLNPEKVNVWMGSWAPTWTKEVGWAPEAG